MNGNKALLVISFGTSFKETREKTINAIEKDLQDAFPDRRFYSAWTSGFIRKKLLKTEGLTVLSPEEALDLMAKDGITDVLIQPTHMLAGEEFEKVITALEDKTGVFEHVTVSRPLLETEEDIQRFARIMEDLFADVKENEMSVFMGHGSDSLKMPVYDLLNEQFAKDGHENFCVGTVEFTPGIEPVLETVKSRLPEKVFLSPLLIVAGDHATNDMAGDDPDSWKNQISGCGTETECIVKGLGEYEAVRTMYVDHAKAALKQKADEV